MRVKHFPTEFKDEGEFIASWGEARLIKYLDGRFMLKGGSQEDRVKAEKWISMFMPKPAVASALPILNHGSATETGRRHLRST
jgi:hypothetical protein